MDFQQRHRNQCSCLTNQPNKVSKHAAIFKRCMCLVYTVHIKFGGAAVKRHEAFALHLFITLCLRFNRIKIQFSVFLQIVHKTYSQSE